MKNIQYLFSLQLFCCYCLLITFFCACEKRHSKDSEADKFHGNRIMAFSLTLPHDKPAMCMQLLADSMKQIKDQVWFCEGIMFNAFDTQNKDIYMQHLDNFEALSKGRFTVLGRDNEDFRAKIDMFRGYKYREVTQYDSAFFPK